MTNISPDLAELRDQLQATEHSRDVWHDSYRIAEQSLKVISEVLDNPHDWKTAAIVARDIARGLLVPNVEKEPEEPPQPHWEGCSKTGRECMACHGDRIPMGCAGCSTRCPNHNSDEKEQEESNKPVPLQTGDYRGRIIWTSRCKVTWTVANNKMECQLPENHEGDHYVIRPSGYVYEDEKDDQP